MIYDIIVSQGANLFFWIAACLIGVLVAFSIGDVAKSKKKEKEIENEKE